MKVCIHCGRLIGERLPFETAAYVEWRHEDDGEARCSGQSGLVEFPTVAEPAL